jgi:hypothetical protein
MLGTEGKVEKGAVETVEAGGGDGVEKGGCADVRAF